jgi:hypothetical protein
MQSDWLDLVDWKLVVVGIAIGVFAPAVLTLLLVTLGMNGIGGHTLLLTEVAILTGSLVAALRADGRRGRLVNGLLVAFICAIVSLVAAVLVNPQSGTNATGLLFLLASYGVMGVLGALLSTPVANRLLS